MNKISLFKKFKLFREFKQKIKNSKAELERSLNIRIDNSYRMYTVLNIPEDLIGEAYSLKKSDIDKISENFTREFTIEVSKFLDTKGLKELYEIYEIKKVDKYSYLIVIGFSLFKSNKYYDRLYYRVIPASIILSIILSLILLL
jgi:uncharacterized protein with ParB-like and HNH nuclease domain